jgi:enamine deaminase RidA (YjgF/YER057c/UK114 family)
MARTGLTPKVSPYGNAAGRTFAPGITAFGSIWTSGCTAGQVDSASGKTMVVGTLVEQARIALDKIRLVLDAAGLPLTDIRAMMQYVPPAALPDMPKLFEMYREAFGGNLPVINTIVVKSLLRGRALIEIEAVAGKGPITEIEYLPGATGKDRSEAGAKALEALTQRGLSWADVMKTTELMTAAALAAGPAQAAAKNGGLQVVMPCIADANAGAQVQLAATRNRDNPVICLSAEANPAVGGVAEQCREIYERLGRQLLSLGSSLQSVVKTTEFVTPEGIGDYRRTADVRREVFEAPYPAATGVICDRLADPSAQISVEVIAVRESP